MKVSGNKTRLDLGTEYDVMFTMPSKRLDGIINYLAKKETQNVFISIKKIPGPRYMLSFLNEQRPDFYLDGGCDNSASLIDDPMDNRDQVNIVMEDRIMNTGIQKAFCMKCLFSIVATVYRFGIDATEVTMYMGTDVASVMVYKYPTNDTREYFPTEAKYCSRKFHEEIVENLKRERDENGDGNYFEWIQKKEAEFLKIIEEVNAEDKRPKLNAEDKRLKLNPKDRRPKLNPKDKRPKLNPKDKRPKLNPKDKRPKLNPKDEYEKRTERFYRMEAEMKKKIKEAMDPKDGDDAEENEVAKRPAK